MSLSIEESFQVPAPAERVWSYLTSPAKVVQCLPGAQLLEIRDDATFVGQVRVKVGPVTATYRGTARFVELDEAGRRIRMTGEGKETGGGGSARMTMSSEMSQLPEGTAIRVLVDMEVAGKLVQFGRGIVEEVARQLFQQFASCVQGALSAVPSVTVSAEPHVTGTAPTVDDEPSGDDRRIRAGAGAGKPQVNGVLLVLKAIVAWSRRILSPRRRTAPPPVPARESTLDE